MNIQSITPKFGENYDVGYIGFTFTADNIVSDGIAYFERWNRMSDIKVAHTFVVTGENELVEAHIDTGVKADCISKYFNDPHTRVFFREPVGWNRLLGENIALAALSKQGEKYNVGLIVADAAAETFLGYWLNKIFRKWPEKVICWLFDFRNTMICSELVAFALASQPEFKHRGCLDWPLDTITPQDLFEDATLFEDWVRASGHGPALNVVEEAKA